MRERLKKKMYLDIYELLIVLKKSALLEKACTNK